MFQEGIAHDVDILVLAAELALTQDEVALAVLATCLEQVLTWL